MMAKKRKVKKGAYILIGVIAFFTVYFISFNVFKDMDKKVDTNKTATEDQGEDTRSLMAQLKSKTNVYIKDESDSELSSIKIDEGYWKEIKYFFSEFSEIRTPGSYKALYSGSSDDGVRFSTDLSYFRVYTVNTEEYYKVPVAIKQEFENIIKKSIYTSFDFIRQYKSYQKVVVTSSTGDKKNLHKWKYDDLANKMVLKRMVGKVQPEKSKERSDYNFAIEIEGKSYQVRVETMGQDYVKITSKGEQSYYEVHTGLFEYLKNDVFKIAE